MKLILKTLETDTLMIKQLGHNVTSALWNNSAVTLFARSFLYIFTEGSVERLCQCDSHA